MDGTHRLGAQALLEAAHLGDPLRGCGLRTLLDLIPVATDLPQQVLQAHGPVDVRVEGV